MIIPLLTVVLVISSSAFGEQQENGICLDANPGKICGSSRNVLGKDVVQFLGVPFALPPVGARRFQAPEYMDTWEHTIDATKHGKSCMQNYAMKGMSEAHDEFLPDENETSEDCLFLNIIAPQNAQNLPVMIWIHGGLYLLGSSSVPMYDAVGMVVNANVIFVSINYRLGILGFGSLSTNGMPGNMGLFDQRMAMKWVHENIAAFGGNPEKVTIHGESAGGVSVACHLVAPESQQYFSSAIVQSGTLFTNWALMKPEVSKSKVVQLAAHLGCTATNDDGLVKCLHEVPAENLTISLGASIYDLMAAPVNPDPGFFGGDAFGQLARVAIFGNNKTILVGHTAEEAGFMIPYCTNFRLGFKQEVSWKLEDNELEELAESTIFKGFDQEMVGRLLMEYRSLDIPNVFRAIKMMSEIQFDCPTLEFVRALIANNNSDSVYLYKYDHIPSKGHFSPIIGSYHTSELAFHMGTPLVQEGWSEEDKQFSREIIRVWTSLERSGSPSVDYNWPPVTSGDRPNMKILHAQHPEITTEHQEVRCRLLREGRQMEGQFWKDEL